MSDELYYRIAELERMVRNMVRYVEVDEVNGDGTAKATDRGGGEGKDLPLPKLPWAEVGAPQQGGNGTTWRPPAKGSRMVVLSPSGRLSDGMLFHAAFSDAAGAPSDKTDEHVETRGKTRITWRDDGATIENGEAVINVKDGKVTITATDVEINGNLKVNGNIDHHGNMETSGVHHDSRGYHK